MNPTYLGDIDLTYDTLEHYGVKGMKWRFRKGIHNIKNKLTAKSRKRRYAASHIMEDRAKGKAYLGEGDKQDARMRVYNNTVGKNKTTDDFDTFGKRIDDYNSLIRGIDKNNNYIRTPKFSKMYASNNKDKTTNLKYMVKAGIAQENKDAQLKKRKKR